MATAGVGSGLGSSWVMSLRKAAEGEILVGSSVCEPGWFSTGPGPMFAGEVASLGSLWLRFLLRWVCWALLGGLSADDTM
jgi:hypothetical protein